MAITINRNVLNDQIRKFNLSSVEDEAIAEAQKEILKIKKDLIEDFQNHPVTKEIEAGAEAENISSTLNGEGNLTTYIGFSPTSNPTEPVKNILETININRKAKKNFRGSELIFEFDVTAPSIDQIESVAPLPFEQGQSWVRGIENGISGFGAYIYGKIFKNSRSGKGLQSKNSFRSGAFRPVRYMSEIMGRFYSRIKR